MNKYIQQSVLAIGYAFCLAAAVQAGELTTPHTFVSGEPAVAAEVNENFQAVETEVDDNAADIATLQDGNAVLTQRLGSLPVSVILRPVLDTYVNLNADTTPNADEARLVLGDTEFSDIFTLLQFNVSLFPADAVIHQAELRLWLQENTAIDKAVCVQQVTSPWDASVIYSNPPTLAGSCVSSQMVSQSAAPYVWSNLQGLVQAWVNGSEDNFGMALVLEDVVDSLGFKSFSSSEGHVRPELVVRYSIAP